MRLRSRQTRDKTRRFGTGLEGLGENLLSLVQLFAERQSRSLERAALSGRSYGQDPLCVWPQIENLYQTEEVCSRRRKACAKLGIFTR